MGEKHMKRPFTSSKNEFDFFLVVRNDVIIKMAEKCLFFAKIGYYTTLGHPISTNYTIFRNLRASLIHWTSLFWNLKSSKIKLCKGLKDFQMTSTARKNMFHHFSGGFPVQIIYIFR